MNQGDCQQLTFLSTNHVMKAARGRYFIATESLFQDPGNWVMLVEMLAKSAPTSRKKKKSVFAGPTTVPE